MIRRLLDRVRPPADPWTMDDKTATDTASLERRHATALARIRVLEARIAALRTENTRLRQADTGPLPAVRPSTELATRLTDLTAEVARLRAAGLAPLPDDTHLRELPPRTLRELVLRERETHRNLTDEVYRLTMASLNADGRRR